MRDALDGVIVGGNYEKPNEAKNSLAFTSDGGETWKPGPGLAGYRSGVVYVDKKTIIAVGTNGTDMSTDGGETWRRIGTEDLNAVAARGKNAVWAVGPKGVVVKLGSNAATKQSSGIGSHPPNVSEVVVSRDEVSLKCPGLECDYQVDVAVVAPDIPDIKFIYKVSGGRIVGGGPNVKWDLSGVRPGRYTITAAVNDGGPWGPIGMTRTKVVTVIE
jgi:hypothetical protein